MNGSTPRRQLQLGATLLAASFLPMTMSTARAESATIGVATDSRQLSTWQGADFQQQAVPYGDLDLEAANGFETLNNRIAAAVRNVCMHSDPRELDGMRRSRQCRERAQARAIADIQELDGAELFGTK